MRNFLLLFACLAFLMTGLKAQQIGEVYEFGNTTDLSGTKVTYTEGIEPINERRFTFKNTSGSTKTFQSRRYELSVVSGTKNYWCWKSCYSAVNAGAKPAWTAPAGDTLILGNGDVFDKMYVYVVPQGNTGSNVFRMVYFDLNNPNDSIYFDVEFDLLTGIENDLGSQIGLSIYPNPAKDIVFLSSEKPIKEDLSLEIRDLRGVLVRADYLNRITSDGQMIDLSGLESGIYMITLTGESGTATRKIVKY